MYEAKYWPKDIFHVLKLVKEFDMKCMDDIKGEKYRINKTNTYYNFNDDTV